MHALHPLDLHVTFDLSASLQCALEKAKRNKDSLCTYVEAGARKLLKSDPPQLRPHPLPRRAPRALPEGQPSLPDLHQAWMPPALQVQGALYQALLKL